MARRILEEMYYENIKPRSKNFIHSESYNKSMQILDEYETLLIKLLDGKELKIFTEYVDAWGEVHGTDITEKWVDGFKIGLQIGMAVYSEEDSCIEDLM